MPALTLQRHVIGSMNPTATKSAQKLGDLVLVGTEPLRDVGWAVAGEGVTNARPVKTKRRSANLSPSPDGISAGVLERAYRTASLGHPRSLPEAAVLTT